MLAFPAFDRGFLRDTDASGVGLGAVLAQKQLTGLSGQWPMQVGRCKLMSGDME